MLPSYARFTSSAPPAEIFVEMFYVPFHAHCLYSKIDSFLEENEKHRKDDEWFLAYHDFQEVDLTDFFPN